MESIKILKSREDLNWDYNEETDVFFFSIGKPQIAVGVQIGEGLIVRYDECNKEVIGVILTGLRDKVLKKLDKETAFVEEEKLAAEAERQTVSQDAESAVYGKQSFDHGGEA